MIYLAWILAWAIVIWPWGLFAYLFYKALDNCEGKWLACSLLTLGLIPLYYILLHQVALDFGQ